MSAASMHQAPGAPVNQAPVEPRANQAMTQAMTQAWDQAADGWDANAERVRAWLHEASAAMLDAARLRPGARVLDVAAGAGDQTLDIAHRVGPTGEVLATDIAGRMVALAQARVQAAGLTQVRTRAADAQALGLAGACFDAAICRLGLMFCAAPRLALAEMHAALAPGGRVSVLVFSHAARNPCIAMLMQTARRHAGLPPADPQEAGGLLSLGAPGLLARLLAEAGFVDVEVQALDAPFRLPSSDDYVDFVQRAGSPAIELLRGLPAGAQQAAWDDIHRQLAVFDTPGGWAGPNELLLGSATRPG